MVFRMVGCPVLPPTCLQIWGHPICPAHSSYSQNIQDLFRSLFLTLVYIVCVYVWVNVSEENQRVASCVFPAAMAVISPPLSLHRRHTQSALSLITSCLASNGTHIYLLTQSLEPFLPDCTYNFTIIIMCKVEGTYLHLSQKTLKLSYISLANPLFPGSVQSRFGMVGGLQCLMSALRELTKVERGGEMDKLCVCLLQCISATASGHCKTCDYT